VQVRLAAGVPSVRLLWRLEAAEEAMSAGLELCLERASEAWESFDAL